MLQFCHQIHVQTLFSNWVCLYLKSGLQSIQSVIAQSSKGRVCSHEIEPGRIHISYIYFKTLRTRILGICYFIKCILDVFVWFWILRHFQTDPLKL